MIEVFETTETHGSEVAAARNKQLMRNAERRRLNRDRKRYAAIALEHNMRRAADKMADRKLAQRANPEQHATQSPESGRPTPASVSGVGVFPTAEKKPPASVAAETGETVAAGKEAATA
jgi:hypothetical protein